MEENVNTEMETTLLQSDEAAACQEPPCEEQSPAPAKVCAKCGAPLSDGQNFCPKCGAPQNAQEKRVCTNCGAELREGQEFCTNCGANVGTAADNGAVPPFSQPAAGTDKKKKKGTVAAIVIAAAVVVVAVVLILVLRGPSVEELTLSETSLELKIDDTQTVSYTIEPEKAADVEVAWESSDESVAKVNSSGKITAKGEGSCTITATAGGKSDSLKVTVTSGPDFQAVYDACGCQSSWAYVSSDGSYMTIDTNPYDIEDYMDYDAYMAIYSINAALGLPDSLMEKMGQTRALDGRQSQTYGDVTVSWTYHPDDGLEILYEAN